MTHYIHPDILDLGPNHLKNNTQRLILCDGAPTTYGQAVTNNGSGDGRRIAEATTSSGDFTVQAGTPDGREVVAATKSGLAVLADGDGTHVAWVDVTNTKLLRVVPVPSPQNGLTTVATVSIPTHKVVFRAPVVLA